MRRLFLKVEDSPDLAVNKQAAELHRNDLANFRVKVKDCVEIR